MDYIIYFVITIAILVFVHEFGHFAAAKLSGMRADVFAIGFGKRLFGYNKINGFTFGELPKDFDTQGNTDYRVSLIPLGGYVKIAGMVDESFDTDFASKSPEPYEFRAKSTPKKLFVITAGVLMNLLLTLIIFWGINFSQGKQVITTTSVGPIEEGTVAAEVGFETGDEIVAINGKKVDSWNQIQNLMLVENVGQQITANVERNGVTKTVQFDQSEFSAVAQEKGFPLQYSGSRPYISEVLENSPAKDAGIKAGDLFLKLNGKEVQTHHEFIDIVSSNKEKDITGTILRGEEDTVNVTVNPGMEGKIGVRVGSIYTGPVDFKKYGFFASIGEGVSDIGNYTALTIGMVGNVISGDIQFNQAFGGPVKIAQFAAKTADTGFVSFLSFLALLSLSLAIINIMPFPVLDGGHMIIILIEGIARREIPLKVKIAIQNAGFILLLILMAFIIYNDIISL